MIEKLKMVSVGTLARTGVLALALINAILEILGVNPIPFSETGIYEAFTAVWLVISGVVAWWKNNSFTRLASIADSVLKTAKETGEVPVTYDTAINSDLLPDEASTNPVANEEITGLMESDEKGDEE